MTVFKRDNHYHTYADYFEWSRTHGDEVIDGTAYVREPPSPTELHQDIALELAHQVKLALYGKPLRVYMAPLDVRLPKGDEADDQVDTVVQPDVFIISGREKAGPRGVRGAPLWLTEVLSPSTAGYDRTLKLAAYERAGVREVWLIDPVDLTVTIYRLEAGRYGPPAILELKGRTQLTAVPDVTIDWDWVCAEM